MKIINFISVSGEFITEFGHNMSDGIYSSQVTASCHCLQKKKRDKCSYRQ